MALYNNVSLQDAKIQATAMANEMERQMARWKYWADTWAAIPQAEMTALGMSEDYYAQITSLKSDVLALEAWFRTNCLFVKRFAQLTVF